MAIIVTPHRSSLRVEYDTVSNQTYNNVKDDISPAAAGAFLGALATLQSDEPESAFHIVETAISDDGN